MDSKIEKLDSYVLKTLDTLDSWQYPQYEIPKSDLNVFMGSGSGACVAKMFAQKFGGVALKAHDYKDFLNNSFEKQWKAIYIVSASGGKDAVLMAKLCKDLGFECNLITCNQDAPAKEYTKEIIVFPSFSDPPTYNVSTYFSMMHWMFNEDVKEIKEKISQLPEIDLKKYKFVFLVSDDKFHTISEMGCRKIGETIEGIGSNGEGISQANHGVILQPNKDRLVIRLNCDFKTSGDFIDINFDSHLGLLACVYYLIGKSQNESDIQNTLEKYSQTVKENNWQLQGKQ